MPRFGPWFSVEASSPAEDLLAGIVEEARRERPEPGSAKERELLVRLGHAVGGLLTEPVAPETAMRKMEDATEQTLEAVERREIQATDVETKLALRALLRATLVNATSIEMLRLLPEAMVAAGLEMEAPNPDDPGAASLLRMHLAMACAFSAMDDGEAGELSHWARVADVAARRVAARQGMARLAPPFEARLRARGAWGDWDEAEVAAELAKWPEPS